MCQAQLAQTIELWTPPRSFHPCTNRYRRARGLWNLMSVQSQAFRDGLYARIFTL